MASDIPSPNSSSNTGSSLSSKALSVSPSDTPSSPNKNMLKPYSRVLGNWRCSLDPSSGRYYWTDLSSAGAGKSQWDMPPEWVALVNRADGVSVQRSSHGIDNDHPASATSEKSLVSLPLNGAESKNTSSLVNNDSNASISSNIPFWQTRPARRQVSKDDILASKANTAYTEGAQEYNIWYDKYLGDHHRKDRDAPAPYRCIPARDAGLTRADAYDGFSRGARTHYFCYHFAKGACFNGPECTFLHRVPTLEDATSIDEAHDVFGRERFAAHRDDMGGVGTFQQDCRTLYVGGLVLHDDIEDVIHREFADFGPIEELRIIRRLNIAFVRYFHRVSAEFGKAAMEDQLLGGRERINVRWAYEDPNPKAQALKQEEQKRLVVAAAVKRGIIDGEGNLTGSPTGTKRLRDPSNPTAITGAYPDTSDQYFSGGVKTKEQIDAEEAQAIAAAKQDRLDQVFKKIRR